MIVVGLGNPGKEYEKTYHNMGYGVVDALAEKIGRKIDKVECSCLTCVKEFGGEKTVLAKPITYMNLSGEGVKSLVSKYGDKAGELIVIYDDIDLPRFSVRVRKSGSGGTHNGMRNVVKMMQTEDVVRMRIGVGKPEHDLVGFVLSKPDKEDEKKFDALFSACADLLYDYIVSGDFDKFMREANNLKL